MWGWGGPWEEGGAEAITQPEQSNWNGVKPAAEERGVCVRLHVCVQVRVCVHESAYVCVCVCVHAYSVWMHIYVYICVQIGVCVRT